MKRRYKIGCIVLLLTFIAYILSWKFPGAVDFYRLSLFPAVGNILAGVMSWIPWSVGELLILAGIVFLLTGIVIAVLFLLFYRKKIYRKKLKKTAGIYVEILCWILLWTAVTETANCFVFYHATPVEEACFSGTEIQEDTLVELYQYLVIRANALSEQMQRGQDGKVIYDGDLYQKCKTSMQALGETYPYLKGYYPNPKPIANSDFMSQQYLLGIYFPFTMEANYNQIMYVVNRPATICHELSHLKGVILEDEANYFGFLACICSDDEFLSYSGYLSVLSYVTGEVRDTVPPDIRKTLPEPNAYVQKDAVFLTKEEWERVEDGAVFHTENVSQATDTFLEKNLKTNGVSDGMVSYSRVVRLLCLWYQTQNT